MKHTKRDASLDVIRILATFFVMSVHFFSQIGYYEQVMAGTLADGATGNTDSGNTFEVINKDGIVKIRVTCSEQTAESESENTEAENTETEENSSEQTAAASEEKPATSPVITPGQSQESAEEQENTEDQQSAENQESTTEQQPEENQENTEG